MKLCASLGRGRLAMVWLAAAGVCQSAVVSVLVEAEGFSNSGGWKADTVSVEQMGSVYAIAHGMGTPVADASTTVAFPEAGTYRVWVRTRNWVTGAWEAPGRFKVAVNGADLAPVFGTELGTWHWQAGGTVEVSGASASLAIKDLTGFDGRCDAIAFIKGSDDPPPAEADALKTWRRTVKNEAASPTDVRRFDCVVAGGGMAGCCAALAAARSGVRVALVQDRPVLGGNASQEVRVATRGQIRSPIVDEIDTTTLGNRDNGAVSADDARLAKIQAQQNITLFMPWRAEDAGTDPATKRITHVDARHIQTGARVRLQADTFIDCTGDGWIGYWAGADYRMGTESSAEFGESLGKPTANAMTMGNSLMWKTKTGAADSVFPEVPWAMEVAGTRAATGGDWNWEYGMEKNTINDAEHIRDWLLRAIYGNFSNAKKLKNEGVLVNPKLELDWVPYITGKRESRRLMGDHIVTQQDMVNGVYFEDAVGTTDWGIDLHVQTSVSYLSDYKKTDIAKLCYFPFRSLYSRNVPNLMMAGRNFSCTHVGLGSPRVQNTTGQMGVAVGYAAALCKEHNVTPRDIYRNPDLTTELQARIAGSWPARPSLEPVIVDNANSSGVSLTGAWTASTGVTPLQGADYLLDGSSGRGTKRVAFTPSLTLPGRFSIDMCWTQHTNRSSSVPVWVLTSPPQITSLAPNDLIFIRNAQPTQVQPVGEMIVGRFAASDYTRGLLRFDLSAIPAKAALRSAELVLTIGTPDATSGEGFAGAEGIRVYRVAEAFTPASTTWNQRATGTAWTTAGAIPFPLDPPTPPLAVIVSPTYPSLVQAGEEFIFPGGEVAAAAANARNLGQPLQLMVRTPTLESTWATRKLYRFASASLRVSYFVPQMPATYTVNQQLQGSQWVTLGTHDITTEGATVVVGNDGANGYVVADAVKFSPTTIDDRDNDRLPDWWERWHFLSETVADPNADDDHDGQKNLIEYLTGRDPNDASSRFDARMALDGQAGSTLLRWPSAEGRAYRIEASEDCQTWGPVVEHVAATPPQNEHPVGMGGARRFFRVVLEE